MKSTLIALSLLGSIALHADWRDTIRSMTDEAKTVWDEQTKALLAESADENITARSQRLREEHFNAIWEDVIANLEKGLEIKEQMKKAPESAIFAEDKSSIRKEFDEVLDDIIALILDDGIFNYRKEIRDAEESIASLKKSILKYREKKITAPLESKIRTTKAQYDSKIIDARTSIIEYRKKIAETKVAMSQSFKEQGIDISPDQIDVLLSRVDGDDIIQMTLVMDVLKQITQQLLGIMQESGEELVHAKKYYGMHMVLLELVVYIQEKFISKIENKYIPRINQITDQTQKMLAKTSERISAEENLQRRNIYYQNYESQKLTLKTAILYRQNLVDEMEQVREAIAVSRKNLELSKNTYETVTLSSDLFKIISTSQEMMKEVMRLQVPTIIPFENIQIKEKYRELTEKIRK